MTQMPNRFGRSHRTAEVTVRRALFALVVGAIVFAGAYVSGAPSASSASAVVAAVTDGDTLRLSDGRRVRLIQIDSPELGTGDCYSRAARTALLRLTPVGSRMLLEADPTLDKIDRYGRLLRYIHRNGVNTNVEMVRLGAAAPYFYRSERAVRRASRRGRDTGEGSEARVLGRVSRDPVDDDGATTDAAGKADADTAADAASLHESRIGQLPPFLQGRMS